jgi:hypothetical protein
MQFYNGATFLSVASGTSSTCATSTRLSVTGTVPATCTNVLFILTSTGTGAISDAHQIDSVLLEESSTVNTYFDGSTSAIEAAWTGTANNSTSTYVPKVYFDAALLEQSSTVGDYFDGSTRPNSIWTGTAHESTSRLIGRANLCLNPSFETNTTHWGGYSGTVALTDGTIDGGTGAKSLVFTAGSGGGVGGPILSGFAPAVGAPITASLQCLRTSGSQSYSLRLEFYNSKSITAASGNGTTVTYTTSAAHNFIAGNTVTVAGITTTTAYNGTFTIASVPSPTTFTVTAATTGTGTISGDETAVRTLAGVNATAQPCAISTRLTVSGTVPATASLAYVTLYSGGTAVEGDAIQIDSVLVEYSSSVGDYFDGYNDENSSWAIVGDEFINFSVKQAAAKAATTSNITIATALNNADSLDGITLATGDYVLVKNQTIASENGVYQVAVTPVRITNLPVGIPLSTGFRTYVWGSGTQNTETMFTLNGGGVVGANSPAFTATGKPFAWDDPEEFKLWQIQNKYYGYKAGSLQSLEETVKRYLIGTKDIRINYTHPFQIIITTLRDETLGIYDGITSSELILNAIAPIVPMGFTVSNIAVDNFAVFTIGSSIIGTGELG